MLTPATPLLPLSVTPCSDYSSWREEGGRLPDGRHYKTYYLIETGADREKLVITAEDSHRKDR